MPANLYSFSTAKLKTPFTPQSPSGQWWNKTVESPDKMYSGGNTLSGNQPAVTSQANAITTAADEVPDTTPTTPTAQTDLSGYMGRPGETPGNNFLPQYSVSGAALPGSYAAMLQAINGNPLQPDAEVQAQAASMAQQNAAGRQTFEDKSLMSQFPQANSLNQAQQLKQREQQAQTQWNQQHPAASALEAFQGAAAGNQQYGMGAYGMLSPGSPNTDQYGGYWFDQGNPVRNSLGSGWNLGGGSNSYDLQLQRLQQAADAEQAAMAKVMTPSQFEDVTYD